MPILSLTQLYEVFSSSVEYKRQYFHKLDSSIVLVQYISQFLFLCSAEERNSHKFRRTIPLKCLATHLPTWMIIFLMHSVGIVLFGKKNTFDAALEIRCFLKPPSHWKHRIPLSV